MKTILLGWIAWGGLAQMQITVRVVNGGLIPVGIRQRGERLADRILRSAGVAVRWQQCPCPGEPGPGEFRLHIVSRPPRGVNDATGFAVIFPSDRMREAYAGVYYRNVERTAEQEDTAVATVFGATLAHEIGHLLLGSNRHSPSGVMRVRLRRAEFMHAARGELRFSAEEVARIRKVWSNDTRM